MLPAVGTKLPRHSGPPNELRGRRRVRQRGRRDHRRRRAGAGIRLPGQRRVVRGPRGDAASRPVRYGRRRYLRHRAGRRDLRQPLARTFRGRRRGPGNVDRDRLGAPFDHRCGAAGVPGDRNPTSLHALCVGSGQHAGPRFELLHGDRPAERRLDARGRNGRDRNDLRRSRRRISRQHHQPGSLVSDTGRVVGRLEPPAAAAHSVGGGRHGVAGGMRKRREPHACPRRGTAARACRARRDRGAARPTRTTLLERKLAGRRDRCGHRRRHRLDRSPRFARNLRRRDPAKPRGRPQSRGPLVRPRHGLGDRSNRRARAGAANEPVAPVRRPPRRWPRLRGEANLVAPRVGRCRDRRSAGACYRGRPHDQELLEAEPGRCRRRCRAIRHRAHLTS